MTEFMLPAHRVHVEFAEWGVTVWDVTASEAIGGLVGYTWYRPVIPYFTLKFAVPPP